MFFRKAVLCKDLNQYNKLIIYGTGNFAQEIYPQLVEYGLKEKILCFMQTETEDDVLVDGIPVVSIGAFNCDSTECVVLIATSRLYTDEIKQTLLRYGYSNIIVLVDYWIRYQKLEKDYFYLETFEEYCEYIADWYVRNKMEVSDRDMALSRKIADIKHIGRKRKNLNLIVMICGYPSPRTNKIAGALIRKKYDIVMLRYSNDGVPWCLDELQKVGVQIYQCSCIAEMLYCALQYYPLVYFFEPIWGDCLWAEIMFKNKQYFGKVILALYDVLNDGYVGKEEEKLRTERYALEHADGIVWRWYSKEYLEKKGFEWQGKSIQFLDYCNHELMDVVPNERNSSVVKLCAVEGHGDEYVEERTYSDKYLDWARVGEILEKIGNRADCVFHFYVGIFLSEENIRRCKQFESQYKNFRFFLAMEHAELLQRLRDYDYGCEIYTGKEAADDDVPVGEYYSSMFKNSTCNKYFDFLSAGLPIVMTHPSKICEYLSSYDVVVKMNLSDLDINYLKQHKEYYKEKAVNVRRELDIDNQIAELIQFFNEV
ncbi:MAG: hypothetical protein HDR28_01200 [Lachnospiraceae bacterium]|nr:hypothetical protein [Lachnospiraceae bacterium]